MGEFDALDERMMKPVRGSRKLHRSAALKPWHRRRPGPEKASIATPR
jgi:hypothetical protein